MKRHTYFLGALALIALVPAPVQAQNLIITNSLSLWLRADAGATVGGGTVSAWADQSGHGFNGAAPSAAAEPTYVASDPLINNKPALRFDGSNDRFHNTTFDALTNTTGYTAYYLARPDSLTPNQFVFMSVDDFSRSATYQIFGDTAYIYAGGDAQSGNSYGGIPLPGSYILDYTLVEVVYDGTQSTDATRLQVFTNAVAATFNFLNPIPSSILSTLSGYTVGAREPSGDTVFDGDLAEVLVFDRTLTAAERLGVRSYLGDKYDIQGIPEPASAALLVASAVLLWLRRR
jgi:hypothetical protein